MDKTPMRRIDEPRKDEPPADEPAMDERSGFLAAARRAALAREGGAWVASIGTSMSPVLRPGDRVRVTGAAPGELKIGDLITAQRPDGALVTHRFLGWDADGARLVTRGDNEIAADPPIAAAAVVGRVVSRDRLGRVVDLDSAAWRREERVLRAVALAKRSLRRAAKAAAAEGPAAGAGGQGSSGLKSLRERRELVARALARAVHLDQGQAAGAWSALAAEDEDAVVELLREHRVAPWLAGERSGAGPGWARRAVECEAARWRGVCVYQLLGFDAALDALREAGPIIVLKGPAFAELLYGSAGGRPFTDIDLVVREDRAREAGAALQAAGWRYAPRRRFRWQRSLSEHNFVGGTRTDLPRIELHTNLVDKPEFVPGLARHPEWLWAEAVPAVVAGRDCLVLGPEATVLHAALHWHLHNYAGVGWGLDVALAASERGGAVDWDRVIALARRWGMANVAWLALCLSRVEYGAEVPSDVLGRLRPKDPLVRWSVRLVARRSGALRTERRRTLDQVLVFTLRDKWWRRIGALVALPARVLLWVPERAAPTQAPPAGPPDVSPDVSPGGSAGPPPRRDGSRPLP